jgi:hypothetical protein
MEGYRPFCPLGNLAMITAATTAPTGVQSLGTNKSPEPVSYEVCNQSSTIDAYLSWGPSAAEAATLAVIPSSGNPKPNVIWLPARSIRIISVPYGSYFSGITASSTASITVQPGEGN